MTEGRSIALLDADPDLGQLLTQDQREEARRLLAVRFHAVEPGPWDGERLREAGPENVGLLMLDGLMTRELALADNVSGELLGPGDLVRPWQAGGPERLVPFGVRWTVLEPTRLAVLDRRFAVTLTRFPQVNAMLIDRLTERSQRLGLMQAISQLNGVDRRLLTLFWHLAERWGRVTSAGVSVGVSVPHRVIAQLVGARRPTVSTALSQLAERGELVRQVDGTWLLTGAPVGLPTEEAARIVRRRRRRFEQSVADAPVPLPEAPVNGDLDAAGAPALPVTGRITELHDALAALRADNARYRAEFAMIRDETADLMERLGEQRARRIASLERRPR
jgi:CRP/FNR family transcriptional regulator, cyclic AMP receptor protein